jgi:copper oxidase (laccase) domain-containing protein
VGVHVADCLPIALAGDGGVAMLHGGWRGLAAGVVDEGVAALRAAGVAGPLEAVIGPGAGGCCYETGPEVHAVFARYSASDGRLLDLKAVATAQLHAAGVETVDDVGLCTLCAPEGLLFSHRRDGPDTGRQGGFAWLR